MGGCVKAYSVPREHNHHAGLHYSHQPLFAERENGEKGHCCSFSFSLLLPLLLCVVYAVHKESDLFFFLLLYFFSHHYSMDLLLLPHDQHPCSFFFVLVVHFHSDVVFNLHNTITFHMSRFTTSLCRKMGKKPRKKLFMNDRGRWCGTSPYQGTGRTSVVIIPFVE